MKCKISILILLFLSLRSIINAQGMTIDSNGNVVIGSTNQLEKLSVDGIVESTGEGFKFPDGTVQITASYGGGGSSGSYLKVAIVAQGGGDYTDPLSAMNEMPAWCGTPSVTNPCLIKLMPGVYDLGTNNLQMQEYVDIEGSGENVTKITGTRDNIPGVVSGSDNAEIRFLTVENRGGGVFAYALTMHNSSPKVTNVTAIASGASEQVGFDCETNCSSVMTNVTAIASGGTAALGFYIGDSASPTIINSRATASDAVLNLGFDISHSSPIMNNVTAVASGGTNNHAFHSSGICLPVISYSTAIASNGSNENYAFYNINSSSPVVTNSTMDAYGGANNIGVYNRNFGFTGGNIRIDHSIVRGTTNAVYIDTTFTAMIGNTRIVGPVTGSGTVTCAGVYDDNYTFYSGPACP